MEFADAQTWNGPENLLLNGSSLSIDNFSLRRYCQQKYDESVNGGRAMGKTHSHGPAVLSVIGLW